MSALVVARVEPELKRRLKRLKADTDVDMEDVVELGLRLVFALLEEATVPDCLANILSKRDRDALSMLTQIAARVKGGRHG